MITARRVPFALSLVVSLVVLFAPGDDVPSAPHVDKLVHAGLFALLAATGRWAGIRPLPLAGALLAYAALSEVVQAVAPLERGGSPADAAADAVGVLAVLSAARWSARRWPPASR